MATRVNPTSTFLRWPFILYLPRHQYTMQLALKTPRHAFTARPPSRAHRPSLGGYRPPNYTQEMPHFIFLCVPPASCSWRLAQQDRCGLRQHLLILQQTTENPVRTAMIKRSPRMRALKKNFSKPLRVGTTPWRTSFERHPKETF